jgi:diaminopimelate decarboxylase
MCVTRSGDDLLLPDDGLSLRRLADQFGTPLLIYSAARFRENLRCLRAACRVANVEPTIAFALKSCTLIEIARLAETLGLSCEVTSAPEYHLARSAGFAADRIIVNGLGWDDDLLRAAIGDRVALLNIDNHRDLDRVARVAADLDQQAAVGIRIVPDVGDTLFAGVGGKLGAAVCSGAAAALVTEAAQRSGIRLCGISAHVLHRETKATTVSAIAAAIAAFACAMRNRLGIVVDVLDFGGGLDERAMCDRAGLDLAALMAVFADAAGQVGCSTRPVLEPGRFLIGDAGIAVTRVCVAKRSAHRRWLIVDASTNVLVPIPSAHFEVRSLDRGSGECTYSVADRLCSPTSVIQHDVLLPDHIGEGALLAVQFAGAYTWSLAENWTYPLPTVLLVREGTTQVLCDRNTASDRWMAHAGALP